jgi:hypothetical protein
MNGDMVIRVHAESLLMQGEGSDHASVTDGLSKSNFSARYLIKSDSISASTCVVVKAKKGLDVSPLVWFFFFWERIWFTFYFAQITMIVYNCQVIHPWLYNCYGFSMHLTQNWFIEHALIILIVLLFISFVIGWRDDWWYLTPSSWTQCNIMLTCLNRWLWKAIGKQEIYTRMWFAIINCYHSLFLHSNLNCLFFEPRTLEIYLSSTGWWDSL